MDNNLSSNEVSEEQENVSTKYFLLYFLLSVK